MEWNGAHYRLPAFPAATTDIMLTNPPTMPVGELAWEILGTGLTISTSAGGFVVATPTTSSLTTSIPTYGAVATFFEHPIGTSQLKYIGLKTQYFHCAISVVAKATGGGSDKTWTFQLRKNDVTPIPGSDFRIKYPGADEFTVAFHSVVSLATNDHINIWVESNEGTAIDLTVENVNLVAMGTIGA